MNLHRFLLAVFLALGFVGPSHAQIVVFDNLSQTSGGSTLPFLFSDTRIASDFHTDGTAYTITELKVQLDNGASTAHTFTFAIFADGGSGAPGTLVNTFATSPSVPAGGTGLFTATSPGIALQANTTYWVMGQDNQGNAQSSWAATSSQDIDSGTFTTVSATQILLRISATSSLEQAGPGNLKFSLSGSPSPVPEPQTWVALVATTGGFLALRGRRLIRRLKG